jgi:glyoxylase-like metal-dependent hydrolase (beta-lactamase superfamily II)
MDVKAFFHEPTFTLTYVAFDPATRDAVVIDPVLDLAPLTWRTSTAPVDVVTRFCEERALKVHWILDTHAHADHLSGMAAIKEQLVAPTAIGEHIKVVQELFRAVYNLPAEVAHPGMWDRLLADGDTLEAGSLTVKALHTPGHTPACLSYLIEDAVFTGDALFMPDYGTGRCDFPKGSAEELYDSVCGTLYRLPDQTRVFVGHDYLPGGRPLAYETTIGESKEKNIRLRAGVTREDFVTQRRARDAELPPPRLILQSLQVNIRAGALPEPEDNGRRYLKMPIDFLGRGS